jgi:hypothetical protein
LISNQTSSIYNSTETIKKYFNEEYGFTIEIDDPEHYDYVSNNAKFTVIRMRDMRKVIEDSIGCMMPEFEFEDYNKDGLKDILIYHDHGARANTFYYLYLADKLHKTFVKVKGFEKLSNTSIDENKIITSYGLAGLTYYSFYIITKDFKVKQVGKTIEDDPRDISDRVEKEYNRVLSLVKKKP